MRNALPDFKHTLLKFPEPPERNSAVADVIKNTDIGLPNQVPGASDIASTTQDLNRSGEALRDSEIRYRRLFESAQDGILILDAETGLITDVNPFLLELLNYSRAEFLGKELWQIGLFSDIQASKSAFLELLSKKYVRYEDLPLRTKAGRPINVEFVSNVYTEDCKRVVQCNIRDITKRRRAEQSEVQLRQAQKMEALGQLAGGMAHDFNNLLGVILGYCELLESQPDMAEAARKRMITEIYEAGSCAKGLTRHLLAFSRRQVLQPVFLDLNAVVKSVGTMLNRMIGEDIELVSVSGSDLGTIRADPNHIEQVLMNLAVNARDAMPQGGKITITTKNVEIDAAYVQQHPSAVPGSYVMLTVGDTGIGMDKETQSHIFEPFFSTKKGNGTGLGLSTVFGIVKQSAGYISAHSEQGFGTTFNILFPFFPGVPSVIQPKTITPILGGTETILLVDDSAPLRELTRRLLEDSGYTVLHASEAMEAIRIAGQYKGPLPLLITDVIMPGLTGPALAERLTAGRPETRVLFTSGYADHKDLQHPLLDCAFLEKPFTRDDLIRIVRELLDSPVHVSA
jgi:two-component system, cell cycle sensor histidine kinase and response regulator CckA